MNKASNVLLRAISSNLAGAHMIGLRFEFRKEYWLGEYCQELQVTTIIPVISSASKLTV